MPDNRRKHHIGGDGVVLLLWLLLLLLLLKVKFDKQMLKSDVPTKNFTEFGFEERTQLSRFCR